jgi:signal transduction histidine kinase
MVKKLRRKFVITAMSALLVILLATIAFINITNFVEITGGADEVLQILAENDGSFPVIDRKRHVQPAPGNMRGGDPPGMNRDIFAYNRSIETPFSTRYFWVKTDESGNVSSSDTGRIASVTEDEAAQMADEVADDSDGKGYTSAYRYYVKTYERGNKLIIFKDCSSELYGAVRLLRNSLLLMLACLVAMFILVWFMSGFAVSPVVESLEKQKRFITDAGHELKTPLAVISANVDVIELENGRNEWTGSIKNQVNRMTGLVKNMLTLSRMEEETIRVVYTDTDLSSILLETAENFRAVAESGGRNYSVDIEKGVHINGDRNSLVQLASLLIDNAMKYSDDNGNVAVRMSAGKQIVFEVSNTSDNIPDGNLDRLFDRFYRGDLSRNRKSGGYGIGLSVARAIAVSYGGTINATRDGDRIIRFIVRMPRSGAKNRK